MIEKYVIVKFKTSYALIARHFKRVDIRRIIFFVQVYFPCLMG